MFTITNNCSIIYNTSHDWDGILIVDVSMLHCEIPHCFRNELHTHALLSLMYINPDGQCSKIILTCVVGIYPNCYGFSGIHFDLVSIIITVIEFTTISPNRYWRYFTKPNIVVFCFKVKQNLVYNTGSYFFQVQLLTVIQWRHVEGIFSQFGNVVFKSQFLNVNVPFNWEMFWHTTWIALSGLILRRFLSIF